MECLSRRLIACDLCEIVRVIASFRVRQEASSKAAPGDGMLRCLCTYLYDEKV